MRKTYLNITNIFTEYFANNIDFVCTSFDRVVLRDYISSLFVEGSVIKLLRNLGFNSHSNGVLKLLTDQLNSHIKKVSEKKNINIHWWSKIESNRYNSKLDFVKENYGQELNKKYNSSRVVCIIKAIENARTFANKDITTKKGEKHTKMYACNKFVSHYYIYIYDDVLGLSYLKISTYLPFACEFYFNRHNYLKQQLEQADNRAELENA